MNEPLFYSPLSCFINITSPLGNTSSFTGTERKDERKTWLNNTPELGNYRPYSSCRVNERVLSLPPRSCREPGFNSQPLRERKDATCTNRSLKYLDIPFTVFLVRKIWLSFKCFLLSSLHSRHSYLHILAAPSPECGSFPPSLSPPLTGVVKV